MAEGRLQYDIYRQVNESPGDGGCGTKIHVRFHKDEKGTAHTGITAADPGEVVAFAAGAQMRNLQNECPSCPLFIRRDPPTTGHHSSCNGFSRLKGNADVAQATINVSNLTSGRLDLEVVKDAQKIARDAGARCLKEGPLFPTPPDQLRNPHRQGNRKQMGQGASTSPTNDIPVEPEA